MKLHGHSAEQFNLKLTEVVLELRPDEAKLIAQFLRETAERMESMGDAYNHEHLSDHVPEFESSPHFVVAHGN